MVQRVASESKQHVERTTPYQYTPYIKPLWRSLLPFGIVATGFLAPAVTGGLVAYAGQRADTAAGNQAAVFVLKGLQRGNVAIEAAVKQEANANVGAFAKHNVGLSYDPHTKQFTITNDYKAAHAVVNLMREGSPQSNLPAANHAQVTAYRYLYKLTSTHGMGVDHGFQENGGIVGGAVGTIISGTILFRSSRSGYGTSIPFTSVASRLFEHYEERERVFH